MKLRFKDFVLEFAYESDKAIEKIEDLLPQLSLHILKIWLMPKSRDYDHWVKEVENWLNQISRFSRIKADSKIISKAKFQKEFGEYFDESEIENDLYLLRNYKFEKDIAPNVLSQKLQEFFEYLWDSISSKKFNLKKTMEFIKEVKW
jgi:hypothetical protein